MDIDALRRLAITLLLSCAAVAGVAGAQSFVPVEQLADFAGVGAAEGAAGNWISATDDAIWLLHPQRGLLRRSRQSDGAKQTLTVSEIPLPSGVEKGQIASGDLTIAAAGGDRVWLIDHLARRVWLRADSRWPAAIAIGEPIGSAALLRDGRLLINTPAHSTHTFAVIAPDGSVERRFGARLQPFRFGLDEDWNRWAVAVMADGRVIAAHRYSDRVRAYGPQLELLWEKSADFPTAGILRASAREAAESIRVDPGTCCFTAKLVQFAARVVMTGQGRHGIQFGAFPALEEYDAEGRWLASLPLKHREGADVRLRGLAATGNDLLTATTRGAVRMQRVADQRLVEGRIITENKQPVGNAAVQLTAASGARFNATTDDAGRFSVVVTNKSDWHAVTVSARGLRTWHGHGHLAQLLGKPIVLRTPIEQCVRVSDAATGAPVSRFTVEILRETGDERSASRTSGAKETFDSPDGSACIESPWDHPWTVRVTASGYAAGKIPVEQPAELEVRLDPGAALEVRVKDPAGSPVDGVSLRLLPASDTQRAVAMVEDEAVASTGADGTARFENLAPGEYRLEGTSDGFLPFSTAVKLDAGLTREDVELKRGSVARVRVVSRATNREVENAVVMAESLSGSTARPLQCTTGSDGRCSIGGLGPGRYQARARAEGLVEGQRPFQVAPESGDIDIELRLEGSVRLTGRVEGIGQYPALKLDVVGSKPGVPFLVAPIDSQGRFAFEEFPTGDVNVRVRVRDRNSTLVYQRLTIPAGRATQEITLRLPDAQLLHGAIRFRGSGCGVCSVAVEGAGNGVDRFETDGRVAPSGEYAVQIPGGGLYVVRVKGPYDTIELRVLEITSARREDFDLDDRERTTVSVLDDRGAPVESARVLAIDAIRGVSLADVSTDSRGIASLPRLTHATRIIATKQHAQGSVLHPGTNGAKSVEIVIRQSGRLLLDLRDARTGGPVYRAEIRRRSARTGSDMGKLLLVRSDEQPFAIPVDASEPVDLAVKAPGYAFHTVYAVMGGAGVKQVSLTGGLTLGVRIAGTIRPCAFELLGEDGRPRAVSIDFPLGPVPLRAQEAIFNPIEPGSYVAVLHACDGATLRQPALVRPGETTSLVLFER